MLEPTRGIRIILVPSNSGSECLLKMVLSLILYSVSLFAKIERKWSNGHAISIQQFFNYGSTGNVLPRKVSIVNNYPLIRPKQFSSFTSTRTILCNVKSQDGALDAYHFRSSFREIPGIQRRRRFKQCQNSVQDSPLEWHPTTRAPCPELRIWPRSPILCYNNSISKEKQRFTCFLNLRNNRRKNSPLDGFCDCQHRGVNKTAGSTIVPCMTQSPNSLNPSAISTVQLRSRDQSWSMPFSRANHCYHLTYRTSCTPHGHASCTLLLTSCLKGKHDLKLRVKRFCQEWQEGLGFRV